MKRLHIVGGRNHGKTTLIVELVRIFNRRGIRVGTIKHTCHRHALDTPGKDSHRQRSAGADPAAIITPDGIGVYFNSGPGDEGYADLETLYRDCRFVLVEGHLSGSAAKIEVWRQEFGTEPLAVRYPHIEAVVSDDPVPGFANVWKRSEKEELADRVLELLKEA